MGLPTALLLAQSGYIVNGYDIDKAKIQKLNNGILPFEEKGLKELFSETTLFQAFDTIQESDVFIITVPTPLTKEKKCDLSFVESAVNSISTVLDDGNLVILESTVPPGTTKNRVKPRLESTKKQYFLSFVSEKAIPGNTLHEMQYNHRIIGGINKESAEQTKEVYSHFVKAPFHLTDCTTAEIVKLMENTYRDVNIALANEFAHIAEKNQIDVWEAIHLANLHPRVNIHKPGPGVGGHCIPIDPYFLSSNETELINQARKINDEQPKKIVKKIQKIVNPYPNPVVTLLGLSYKANVDDIRESPTFVVKQLLEQNNINVRIHDPHVKNHPENIPNLTEAVKNADCLVLITDHNEFKNINPGTLDIKQYNIIDTRNILNSKKVN